MGDSISLRIGTGSNVDSGKVLKSREDTGVIIESGSGIESPSWGLGSYLLVHLEGGE